MVARARAGVVADPEAAGAGRLYFVNAGVPKGATPSTHPATFVDLTFTAAANTPYHLWIRGSSFADCWCDNEEVRVLINILFPKKLSDVFPVA